MKDRFNKLLRLGGFMAAISCLFLASAPAQTFTNLHSFAKTSATFPYFTNADGANPYCTLILSGTNLFGTTYGGGSNGDGSLFLIGVNGSGFTNFHSFTNSADGNKPLAGLIASGTNLYGTTEYGGKNGGGLVFKINANGTGLSNIYSFTLPSGTGVAVTNSDGAFPNDGLVASGNFLFGTAEAGGMFGEGSLFRVNLDGTGFTNLHSFTPLTGSLLTNGDGANPHSGLVLAGATLYGTALVGGAFGNGTVFAINTNGTGFTNLHSFTPLSGALETNGDGAYPEAGLMAAGGTLFGSMSSGGIYGYGNLFSLGTNGAGFTNFYNFTGGSDGGYPLGALILSGNFLYGTAEGGGAASNGTVFQVNTNGKNFIPLHSFSASAGSPATNADGAFPNAGLVLSTNFLYGTTLYGGSSGNGTVFRVAIQPQLSIAFTGTNQVVLTWPTNSVGFTLQSSTNLLLTNWTAVTSAPILLNGLYTVTNTTTLSKMFYRLVQ